MINFRNINLLKALNRFPFACASAVIATLIGMYILDNNQPSSSSINLILCGILGVLMFVNLKIAVEAHNLGGSVLWGGRAIVALLLAAGYFFLLPDNYEASNTRIFRLPFQLGAIVIFLHLLVSYLPFIKKGSLEDFWEYNKDIFLRFVESGFFAAVLFIGLSIAILALDQLFNLHVDSLVYPRLFFFLSGIFHTFYFLSKFPDVYHDNVLKEPIKPFLIFSQYIILPLVGLYMAILYAYAAKIGFTWTLPKGWVSQLSLWFCVAGIFAYLLNYFTTRFSDLKPVRFFKKYFFLILLLPIVLIFIAIWRRISEYGVTEARYVVALVGVWLLFVSVYHIISKEKDLKVIPISLSLFILFGVFSGPFNMFSTTLKSQVPRFKSDLINRQLLSGGKLVPMNDHVQQDSLWAFTKHLRFMDQRTDMSFVNEWLDTKLEFINENSTTDTIRSNQNAKVLADELSIPFNNYTYNRPSPQKGRAFSYGYSSWDQVVLIEENKFFFRFDSNVNQPNNSPRNISLSIDSTKRNLIIRRDGKIEDQISLGSFIDNLTTNYGEAGPRLHEIMPPKELIFQHQSENTEGIIVFENIFGFMYDNKEVPKMNAVSGHAIITFKQKDE